MKTIHTLLFLCCLLPLAFAQKPDAAKDYNAGLEYFQLKNYEAAIPLLQTAIKKDPDFYQAYRSLISSYEALGKTEEAIACYEKCIKIAPSDKALVFNLSQVHLGQKNYEQAALWLKKALEIDPTYEKAAKSLKSIEEYLSKTKSNSSATESSQATKVYNEALGYYRAGDYTRCINSLKAYAGEVTNAGFYYLLAIAYQQTGYREKAIDAYESALEVDDQHFDSSLSLGTIFYNDRRYDEAAPLLETAYEQRKNDKKLLYTLARAYYYDNSFKKAAPLLAIYTESVRDDAEAFFLLSKAYEKTGDKKKAETAAQEAQKLGSRQLNQANSRSLSDYSGKANEEAKKGNYTEAIRLLEEAVKQHSQEASLHFNLGLNYVEVGNLQKAEEEFAKTIALDPAHAKAYKGLGLLYYDRGDFAKAATYYKASLDDQKDDPYIWYNLGNCRFQLQQFAEAATAYQKAATLKGDEKQFFFAWGLAALRQKDYDNSIQALEKALQLDPAFLEAQYHICLNYVERQLPDKAIAEGEKILKKDDKYAKAYLVIGHAYKKQGHLAEADRYLQIAKKLDPSLKN